MPTPERLIRCRYLHITFALYFFTNINLYNMTNKLHLNLKHALCSVMLCSSAMLAFADEPAYMNPGVMTSPKPYNTASSKPAVIDIRYEGQVLTVTEEGAAKVTIGENATQETSDFFVYNQSILEVDFSEILWGDDIDEFRGKYIIEVPAGVVTNADGELNPAQTFEFYVLDNTTIKPVVTPAGGSDIDRLGEFITLSWDNLDIEFVDGAAAMYLDDEEYENEYPLVIGKDVKIVDDNKLQISLASLEPGTYYLNMPSAYVVLSDGTLCNSFYGEFKVVEGDYKYMSYADMESPGFYTSSTSKPAVMWINWDNQEVELTGNGLMATVTIGDNEPQTTGEFFLYREGTTLEVDFSEILWSIDDFIGKYTIVLPAGVVRNEDGEYNPEQTFEFNVLPATTVKATVTPASDSEINLAVDPCIVMSWDDLTIEYNESAKDIDLDDEDYENVYPLVFDQDVTISEDNKQLLISLRSLTPGTYYLNVPSAYVILSDGSLSNSYYGEYLVIDDDSAVIAIDADEEGIWNVVDLNGRVILSTGNYDKVKALDPGLYIVNGKKVIVRK